METYVKGKFKSDEPEKKQRLVEFKSKLDSLGYEFSLEYAPETFGFRKGGRIESVITELVPFCERIGLDVEEFDLKEYRVSNNSLRSVYKDGRIVRNE